jgi:hypothetical protein
MNKSNSDDEGLGEAFDDMLNGEEVNLNSKCNVTPLQTLIGDENDPNNEVNYSDEDHDYLAAFEESEQAPIDQEGAPAMLDESNQSQARRTTNKSAVRHGPKAGKSVCANEARRDGFSRKRRWDSHSKFWMGAHKAGLLRLAFWIREP